MEGGSMATGADIRMEGGSMATGADFSKLKKKSR
jgi:hypothetical protein